MIQTPFTSHPLIAKNPTGMNVRMAGTWLADLGAAPEPDQSEAENVFEEGMTGNKPSVGSGAPPRNDQDRPLGRPPTESFITPCS